jgi:hypothetical protein
MSDSGRNQLQWHYAQCPIDAPAPSFGPFADLVALWQARGQARGGVPRRGDFEVLDFRDWLGRIFIARVERAPFNLRFVLWGTQLTDWWGVDYTNKTLGELSKNPDLWDWVELSYFAEMDRAPFLGLACGRLDQHDRPNVTVLGLDLPLSEGEGLSHVISAHTEVGHGATIRSVLPEVPIDREL